MKVRTMVENCGDYSQIIKLGFKNEIKVTMNNEELFNGEATHIVDSGNKLSFKDINGKFYEYIKYNLNTTL